jgi:hypothetical protein
MQQRVPERRYKEMSNIRGLEAKTGEMGKKGLYTGIGAGLVLFALVGLLYGSFIGGIVGLNIAGGLLGLPLNSSVLPRIIVGASMVMGVMLAGVVFVLGGAVIGWLTGTVVDTYRHTAATVGDMKAKTVKVK